MKSHLPDSSRRSPLKTSLRLVILLLVGFGIARSVNKAVDEFQTQQMALQAELADLEQEIERQESLVAEQDVRAAADPGSLSPAELDQLRQQRQTLLDQRFTLAQISPTWLTLSGVLYLCGLAPCWLFWHATLIAMGQQPRRRESLRAFYIGHLGKYVPGKALVVLLRAGHIRSRRVNTTVAASSVFVETLTMMAVGSFVAAAILLVLSRSWWLWTLAIALLLASGVPTLPPIFRRIVRVLQLKRLNPLIDQAIDGLSYRLMATGWVAISIGWFLIGTSLWATLRAIPGAEAKMLDPLVTISLLTATVSLAMVAGFLSLLPGGVGVRDYLIITLLSPTFGAVLALCSAILLRLVWLLAEVAFSAILYCFVSQPADVDVPATESPESSTDSLARSASEGPH